MAYDGKAWRERFAERTDLSTQVVHLTRETTDKKVADVLFQIIDQKRIAPSTSQNGFICGQTPAVCFQDAPFASICQNVYFEEKYRKQNKSSKVRYRATGIAFPKPYAYAKGARPVLYEKTGVAKSLLPQSEWWRIVNFDLSSGDSVIDWTHEREWRSPGNFDFEIDKATLLFVKSTVLKRFIELCKQHKKDYVEQARGIVVMDNILY